MTPGAVSVIVMAIVCAWPEKAGNVIEVIYPSSQSALKLQLRR